jgi:hypothetical protein
MLATATARARNQKGPRKWELSRAMLKIREAVVAG